MSNRILLWHRRDLRLSDHRAFELIAREQLGLNVVGVFCFDPQILKRDDIAPARVAFMVGCLNSLTESYRQLGSELLLLHTTPETGIVQLAQAIGAQHVVWTKDVEPRARERDRQVKAALESVNIQVHTVWDQLLCEPGQVLTKTGKPYTVYGPFWKNWSRQPKLTPIPCPVQLQGLTESEQASAQRVGCLPQLPMADEFGYHWRNGFPLEPGESSALEHLTGFCDRPLLNYAEARDYPEQLGTSRLSAALRFGAIGVRTIWQATEEAIASQNSDEACHSITVWQKELAWREFYQHALYFFPELADGPYRKQFKQFPWENNPDHFQAWCRGRTGYPIVDAAMRQLNETGWMHNRCRMIVASFLTKDLIIDWRWGERYFMQNLVDGDLASNNGGWQWSASSGMDPKPLRIFNPTRQAQKFDVEAQYIRHWLPELTSLDNTELLTGNITPLESQYRHYPEPIVVHSNQRSRFKSLYMMASVNV
ncbi:MAG: deoxyribodipyrimidine photolyase [Spirulina sp. SIO3F2]|nr:deoxyribodipyrimidine photolyase [Spirulina sp. SIO3F2]